MLDVVQGTYIMHIVHVLLRHLYRQASFVKPLMAEQRRHVSCVGDGWNRTHAVQVKGLDPAFAKGAVYILLINYNMQNNPYLSVQPSCCSCLKSTQLPSPGCSSTSVPLFLCWSSTKAHRKQVMLYIIRIICIYILN